MKTILKAILIPALFCSTILKSQSYIVKAMGDTLFCTAIDFKTNMRGFIVDLSYTDKNGKKVDLHKRKNIPIIKSIHDYSTIYEVMPLKIRKPRSYYRVGKRVVDGKLQVCLYNNLHQSTTYNAFDTQKNSLSGSPYSQTTSGTYLFYIRMNDGKFYKIKRSTIKKVIKPYLLQCEEFKKEYKGDYSSSEPIFIEMIRLYNSKCK